MKTKRPDRPAAQPDGGSPHAEVSNSQGVQNGNGNFQVNNFYPALPGDGLESVLGVLDLLSESDRDIARDIVCEPALDGENVPLRGTEDLTEAMRRLNLARVVDPAQVPVLVLRLARLARQVEGVAGSRLRDEVAASLRERGLPDDVLDGLTSTVAPDDSARVLQIRVEEQSSPGKPKYAIEAALFKVTPEGRRRIRLWPGDEDFSLDQVDEVGCRFLEQARGLNRAAGEAKLTVEFVLPWSLLGHPVERWAMDDGGYWIGHQFPVVVRSLDRQQKESFHQSWRNRWDLLAGVNAGQPATQRIGWLHDGKGGVPQVAAQAGRVIDLNRRNALTQWLAKEENSATATLGLTFAYQPGDPASMTGLMAAVHEGIPLLVWLRGDGDVDQLERMLEGSDLRALPTAVHKWRRETASSDASTTDARYHVVLLWDDPSDVGRPSERRFAAPG